MMMMMMKKMIAVFAVGRQISLHIKMMILWKAQLPEVLV